MPGPTVLFIGGMHGNEPAGSAALYKVGDALKNIVPLKGRVIGINGNLKALRLGKRYLEHDLNRIWLPDNIQRLFRGKLQKGEGLELDELIEINEVVEDILKSNKEEIYFIDLHTTSAPTVPFVTMSDSILNRQFCKKFSLPIVLGIEEVLIGPMLGYINDLGYVALAFEAGQHEDPNSIKHHESFVWLSLAFSGCLDKKQVPNFAEHKELLCKTKDKKPDFFEVIFRYAIEADENFIMQPGFANFQPVSKNQIMATTNHGKIVTDKKAYVFMPLYQKQGADGFFLIKKISDFWLNFSRRLRKYRFDHLLVLLPGVKRSKLNYYSLIVNTRVAGLLTDEIFHLLGYRKKIYKSNVTIYTKRDFKSRRKVF